MTHTCTNGHTMEGIGGDTCPECEAPWMDDVMEKVDKQVGNAVRRLGGEQKEGRGYCTECGLETQPAMLCKCPFRQQKSRTELLEEIVGEFRKSFDLVPEEYSEWEKHFYKHIEDFLRTSLIRMSDASMGEVKEIVGKHNARILNEYQLQGLGDERLLYPIITKATDETLDVLRQAHIIR